MERTRGELAESKRQKTLVEDGLKQAQAKFQEQTGGMNDGLTLLDKALALLVKARDSCKLTWEGVIYLAFVELNSSDFKETSKKMHETLRPLVGERIYYQPIA